MFEEADGDDANGGEAASQWAVPGVVRAPVPVGPSPQVLTLRAAIDALAAQPPGSLCAEQALVDTAAVFGELQRLHTVGLGRLADVDARGLHEQTGARSLTSWVQAQHIGADRATVAVARRMEAFPRVAAAVLDGALCLAAAQLVQAALVRLRPHTDLPDGRIDGQDGEQALSGVIRDGVRELICQARGGFPGGEADPVLLALIDRLEQIASSGGASGPAGSLARGAASGPQLARLEAAFLVLAGHVEVGQLADCLAVLVDALLPVRLHERAEAAHDRRTLKLVQDPDGTHWRLTGRLDLECGELLHTLLGAELARDPDNPTDTELAVQLHADGVHPQDWDELTAASSRPRSRGEQLHDALSHGAARYLGNALGGEHDKAAVHIVVTVPIAALPIQPQTRTSQPGTPGTGQPGPLTGQPGGPAGQPGALPARAGSGARLPISLVSRWSCDSRLTRQTLNLAGKVLETSHTERTLRAHERRALHTQTGGVCGAAGCRRSSQHPGAILHPHHGNPWSRSGTTSLTDTVLICDTDHAHLHRGHTLLLKDGRRLGPEGWIE